MPKPQFRSALAAVGELLCVLPRRRRMIRKQRRTDDVQPAMLQVACGDGEIQLLDRVVLTRNDLGVHSDANSVEHQRTMRRFWLLPRPVEQGPELNDHPGDLPSIPITEQCLVVT